MFRILGRLRLLVKPLEGVDMPKKLDDIVSALKRDNPDWPEGKVWAIAQSTYKKMKGKMR